MRILKKTAKPVEQPDVKEEKKALDEEAKAADETITLTEEEITQFKEVVPTLVEMLPKLTALLNGEVEIEIIDEEVEEEDLDEDAEIEENEDEDIELIDIEALEFDEDESEEADEVEEVEDEKAEDSATTAATFNAEDILNDPDKRKAIEEALKKKAGDETPKKTFVKRKPVPKKAGDSEIVKVRPNEELVNTPVVRKSLDSLEQSSGKRTFDFHKRG